MGDICPPLFFPAVFLTFGRRKRSHMHMLASLYAALYMTNKDINMTYKLSYLATGLPYMQCTMRGSLDALISESSANLFM